MWGDNWGVGTHVRLDSFSRRENMTVAYGGSQMGGACDKSGNRNVIRHAIRNVMRLAVRRDHETCGKTHLLP